MMSNTKLHLSIDTPYCVYEVSSKIIIIIDIEEFVELDWNFTNDSYSN